MIRDASDFRPLSPRRLVPSSADVELDGPGTRFRKGDLIEEPVGGTLVQLADRRR